MSEQERYLIRDLMTGELIELQVSAVRIASGQMTALQLKALHDSIEQACRIPAAFWWDRKAAAHAEIFNVLADAVNEPLVGRVLSSGAGLAYDLMIAAGRAADRMITSSRQRLLTHLSGGDSEGAALEMEKHLRVLHYMGCLANFAAHRTSA